MKNLKLLLPFILLLFISGKTFAQSGNICDSAIAMPSGNPSCLNNNLMTGFEMWFKFTATSSHVKISVYNPTDTTLGHVHRVDLFSDCLPAQLQDTIGSISSIGSISADSAKVIGTTNSFADTVLVIDTTGLVVGNTYYIRALHDDGNVLCRICGVPNVNFGIRVEDISELTCVLSITCPSVSCTSCVTFTCTSQSCFGGYDWDFGSNASPQTAFTTACASPTVCYNSPGTYTVTLYEAVNHLNFVSCSFIIDAIPVISSVTANPNPACAGDNVFITASATSVQNPTFIFDFGDGNLPLVSTTGNVTHQYGCPGTYPLTVTASNSCGDVTSIQNVTINPPVANFSVSVSNCKTVNFTDLTSCPLNNFSWLWDFGDNTTSSLQNPAHTYASNGNYNVTLTVTDQCGNVTTVTLPVNLTTLIATIIPPVGDNTCGTSSHYSSTVTGGNAPYTYSWTVSSGGTIIGANNLSSVTVNWNGSTTNQTLTLTVTDAHGCIITVPHIVDFCCKPSIIDNTHYTINNITASQFLANGDPNINTSTNTYNNQWGTIGSIYINGVFTVDVSMAFDQSYVFFGPNARIEIPANSTGITLSIYCSKLAAGCNYMWDGIFVRGTNSIVKISDASTFCGFATLIRDADSAVVSINGGIFQIDATGTKFVDNFKDVVVEPYAGIHQGYIKRTTMETSSTGLIAPRTGQITDIGIEINQVGQIFIGDATSALWTNTFKKMLVGIKSTQSNVNIVNNKFQNILQYSPPPCCIYGNCSNPDVCGPTGIAIWVKGSTPSTVFSANIGGAGTATNTITNCSNGIRVDNSTNLNINNNDFTLNTGIPSFGIGIQIQNDISPFFGTPRSILIQNNYFHKFKTAIYTRFTNFSSEDIRNNFINSISPGVNSIGIKVQDANGGLNGHTNVQGNKIDNIFIGIIGINIFTGNFNKGSQPTANIISLSTIGNPNANLYGIWAQNCVQTVIAGNTITKVGGTLSLASSTHWLGIRVDNSPAITVDKNIISNFGSGIYCFQSCSGSRLACNKLNACWFGINFNGANVSNQLASGVANQNQWNGNLATNKMTGNIVLAFPINWYYNTTAFGVNTDPNNQNAAFLFPTPTTITTDICPTLPQFIQNPTPAQRQQMFGAIISDSVQFTSNSFENKYANRQYVYRQLKNHQAWLSLNVPSDSTFQNFFNVTTNDNVGKLAQVQDYILVGDTVNAGNLNYAISANSVLVSNRQTVNGIYLNTISRGFFQYSPADSATLYNIAIQDPLLGGDGVYLARVMLDMLVFDINNNSRMANESFDTTNYVAGKTYPNPNTGSMQLDYDLATNETGQLIIYDLSGKKINTYNLSEGRNTLHINEEGLSNGVYFYNIVIDGELKLTDKIVIIK